MQEDPQYAASSRLRSDGDSSSRTSTISVANSSSSCHTTLSGVGAPRLVRLPERPLVLTGNLTPSSLSCVSRALLPPELSSTPEARVPELPAVPPSRFSCRSEAHRLIRRNPHQHATAMEIPIAIAATRGPKTFPELPLSESVCKSVGSGGGAKPSGGDGGGLDAAGTELEGAVV